MVRRPIPKEFHPSAMHEMDMTDPRVAELLGVPMHATIPKRGGQHFLGGEAQYKYPKDEAQFNAELEKVLKNPEDIGKLNNLRLIAASMAGMAKGAHGNASGSKPNGDEAHINRGLQLAARAEALRLMVDGVPREEAIQRAVRQVEEHGY